MGNFNIILTIPQKKTTTFNNWGKVWMQPIISEVLISYYRKRYNEY